MVPNGGGEVVAHSLGRKVVSARLTALLLATSWSRFDRAPMCGSNAGALVSAPFT
jgi:hypothetical protein